jgi:hypothetical protein
MEHWTDQDILIRRTDLSLHRYSDANSTEDAETSPLQRPDARGHLVFGGPLDVIDDENLHGSSFCFEFQTKLFLHGGK